MQFKLKKTGDPYSQGEAKRNLNTFNKNTHLNSVFYQIQMQEYKSIFEKKSKYMCTCSLYIARNIFPNKFSVIEMSI